MVAPALVLIAHALRPDLGRKAVAATVGTLMAVSIGNTARFWTLDLHAASPVPFSVVVTALLALILRSPATRHPRLVALATVGLLALGLPLSQAWFFGRTDYRRPPPNA